MIARPTLLLNGKAHRISAMLAGLCLIWALGIGQAHAQAAPGNTVYGINYRINQQFAAVPELFRQVVLLVGVVTTMVGIYGFYKGAQDERSRAPLKNFAMIMIGGMFLSIAFLALSAEKSVFSSAGTSDTIEGTKVMNRQLCAFEFGAACH